MNSSQSASWSQWDALLVIVTLSGSVCLARAPLAPPDPLLRDAPDSAFSAERARDHLQIIAREPHLPGSPEHERVREYLLQQLRELGLEADFQHTTWLQQLDGTRAVALWNVVGRLPGTDPSGAVLLMAHYDAVPTSSGANDNGTSVAAILETLRAVQSGPGLRNDLLVLFTDAEELSRAGSRAFVAEHRWFRDVSIVLNMDIRAEGGASWLLETGPENGWILRAFAQADPHPVANSMVLAVFRTMTSFTDLSSFLEAGVQGLSFSTAANANQYHLALDNLDNTSPESMQHQGLHALSLTRFLGNEDLNRTEAPDVVYVTLPVLGFLSYPPAWHWVGIVVAVLLAGVTMWLGRHRGVRGLKGALAGLAMVAATTLVIGLVASEAYDWLRGMHPEYRLLPGSAFHQEGWYFLSMVVLGGATALSVAALLRLWFGLLEMAWGSALILIVGAGALACWLPLAALNLVWPVLFGEAALLFFFLFLEHAPDGQKARAIRLLILGLVSSPVILFIAPMTELLWQAINISQAPLYACMAAIAVLLLLPLLEPLLGDARWRVPALLWALAGSFFGVGLSMADPDPQHPLPARLFYAMDRDEGTAWWATADGRDIPWIRARVPLVSGESGEHQRSAFHPSVAYTAPADPVAAEPPDVHVVKDNIRGEERIVRIAIDSRIRAEVVTLVPAGDFAPTLLAVNDRTLHDTSGHAGVTGWPLTHWGDPESNVEVEISFPTAVEAPQLLLREISYRPEELLGDEAFRRPPHLIASNRGMSDVAIFGTRIDLDIGAPSLASEALVHGSDLRREPSAPNGI